MEHKPPKRLRCDHVRADAAVCIRIIEAKNIAYEFILPNDKVGDISMEMNRRQHIYLIFKEAVNNLVKYSEASNAEVTFKVSNSAFLFTIKDDGKGFDTKATCMGNGIFNMQKRAEEINATLVIDSVPGQGTLVSMILPI